MIFIQTTIRNVSTFLNGQHFKSEYRSSNEMLASRIARYFETAPRLIWITIPLANRKLNVMKRTGPSNCLFAQFPPSAENQPRVNLISIARLS